MEVLHRQRFVNESIEMRKLLLCSQGENEILNLKNDFKSVLFKTMLPKHLLLCTP